MGHVSLLSSAGTVLREKQTRGRWRENVTTRLQYSLGYVQQRRRLHVDMGQDKIRSKFAPLAISIAWLSEQPSSVIGDLHAEDDSVALMACAADQIKSPRAFG
jgi:hypothetical protein